MILLSDFVKAIEERKLNVEGIVILQNGEKAFIGLKRGDEYFDYVRIIGEYFRCRAAADQFGKFGIDALCGDVFQQVFVPMYCIGGFCID